MKQRKRRKCRIMSVVLVMALMMGMVPPGVARANKNSDSKWAEGKGYDGTVYHAYSPGDGTVYYVDSENGNDSNEGTSESQAFKTLDKVNDVTLQPGDSILLKKGSIFDDQQLAPKGRGTEANHILIGTYGNSGNMPVINTNFKYREAILIENMEYVDITGIEVTNDDAFNTTSDANDPNNSKNTSLVDGKKFRPLGVHILINEDAPETLKPGTDGEDRIYKGINLDGCYIHDVDGDENYNTNKLSGGIGIEIKYHNSNNRYPVFDGVTVQNNRIDQVDRCGIKAIRLTELDQNGGNGEEVGGDGERYAGVRREGKNQASLNYVVRNNYLTDIGGDGILVDSTRGAIVENNLLYNHTMRAMGANAGIWSWNAFDTVFQYNESYGGPTYNQDGCSYDSDYNSAGTIFQYNYSHDCLMGFMLIMGGNDTDIIRYNLSQNDGYVWRHIAGNSNTPSYIYNNVFYYNGENWRFVNNNNNDDTNQSQSIRNNWQYFNNIFYNTSETKTSNWKIGDWEKAVTGTNMVYEASGSYAENEIPNAIHADPMFVEPGGADNRGASSGDKDNLQENIWSSLDAYQLQEGSPAIGAGTYVDVQPAATAANAGHWDHDKDLNAATDFYGNALYNGAPDIGLEESNKTGGEFTVEKNAIYRVYDPGSRKYITMTQGETTAGGAERADENQSFTIVGSGSGYKLRIWDDTVSAYRYLAVEDGKAVLSEDTQTVWNLKDQKNGLFVLNTDGKDLTCSEEGVLSLGNSGTEWYLELEEHSHSYNVGGEEIEGFSADQKYDEAKKESGAYSDNAEKFTTEAAEEVYQTGVSGSEIGYRLYASSGEYTLRLYFAEPDSTDKNRTMDILVNGKTVSEAYVLSKDTQELTLTGVYPESGMIDVKVQAAYNSEGKKEDAVLCGISAEKQIRKEIVSRINAGGGEEDGLIADAEYTTAEGAGYYGENTSVVSLNSAVTPDAGVGTAMRSGRAGSDFGYKVKAMPGSYRVKLYFAAPADEYTFDISVNGSRIKEDYNIVAEAGGINKAAAVVYETESKDGFVDVAFQAADGKSAMVNAVIVEAYDKPAGDSLEISKAAGASEQADKTAAMAIDDNAATRWASVASDTNGQAITFELAGNHLLNGIVLDWTPNAMAKDYHIDISEDGDEWETAVTVTDAKQGLNVHTFDSAVGKYVRVVCDTKLNEWAISLTEAEIFGGAAVEGTASSTASAGDKNDGITEVTAGMGYVYKRYSTAEVTMTYDPAEAEYVADSCEIRNGDKLDAVTDTAVDAEKGVITQKFGLKKWDGFQEAENEMLAAQFENLTDSMTEVNVTVSLTSSDGHVTELPGARAYLPASADYELMSALLSEAKELAATAEAGEDRGDYPQASIDALTAAIQTAESLNENSEAAAINNAAVELYEALQLMEDTQIKNTKIMYHKDFSDPSETAPAVSAGTGTVENGVWNLVLGTDKTAKITDAQALDNGYFYIRYKVSDAGDQTLFGVLGDDDTRRIRVGYDSGSGNWFYDGAIDGWGNWAATSFAADKMSELMLKFDSSGSNITTANLWIDGQDKGQKSLAYTSGTGLPAIMTRRIAKTYSVEEIYYTNAEPVTINVSSSGDGSVSQTGNVTSFMEADKTFWFTPEDGKEVTSVKVDGQEVEWNKENNSYTFEYLQSGHTLEVTFDGAGEPEEPEQTVTYHQDYQLDTSADYEGNHLTSGEVKDGALHLALEKGNNDSDFAIAMDKNAPDLKEGTFYTRFAVDDVTDQMLFDLKTDGTSSGASSGYIRIGYEVDDAAGRAAWFFDKEMGNTQGWGDFPVQTAKLEPGTEHEIQIDFDRAANGTYNITLIVDGQNCGTITNMNYGDSAGKFAFGARRAGRNLEIKEVYYTNADPYTINVTAGEGGSVSQTGAVTVFGASSKTLFVTPEEGYEVASVKVNGEPAALTQGQYTFLNISENQTFEVEFQKIAAVDKTNLEAVYNQYKDEENTGYTQETWAAFEEARAKAKEVLDDADADQDAVDNAAEALQDAYAGLRKEEPAQVDKTELQNLYDRYKEIEQENYTDESYQALQDALARALEILNDEEAEADAVTAAVAALNDAKAKLEEKPAPEPADKSELLQLFNDNQNRTETDYTAKAWAQFENALLQAKSVLDDPAATEEQIAEAKEALKTAVMTLEESRIPEEPDQPGTEEPDQPGTEEPDQPGTEEPDQPGTEKPDQSGTGKTESGQSNSGTVNAVETGDNENVYWMFILFAGSGIVLCSVLCGYKKFRK